MTSPQKSKIQSISAKEHSSRTSKSKKEGRRETLVEFCQRSPLKGLEFPRDNGVCSRLTVLFFLAILCGCGKAPAPAGKLILTSFYPMYIATLNVADGVPGVRVENLTPASIGCLHDRQLTTLDRKKIEEADILVVNGAGMEAFLGEVLSSRPGLPVVDASAGILVNANTPVIMASRLEAAPNPHLWVSISKHMLQIQNIAEGLARADTAHAILYHRNAEVYRLRLDSLRRRMHEALDTLPQREIITFHEAFAWFAAEFNLTEAATIEPAPGEEPSAGELATIAEIIRARHIRALFAEPQYPAQAAEILARETGAKIFLLDPAVSGPADRDAYLRIMEQNLTVLSEALRNPCPPH